MNLRDAEQEYAEVCTWTCETCDTMTDEGEAFCLSCKLYWTDVRDGMFYYDLGNEE